MERVPAYLSAEIELQSALVPCLLFPILPDELGRIRGLAP